MAVSAIGPTGAMATGSLSGLGGASSPAAAAAGGLSASLGTQELLMQLLDLINKSTLSESSKVAISDTAKGMLGNAEADGPSMGELSQALIVALMLQLLEV